MPKKELQIAIISDLHCHPSNIEHPDSYFLCDKVGIPALENPVESLCALIKSKSITAEFVVVPGDLTFQVNQDGYKAAWDAINKIATLLKAKAIYATLGNHDVDSRIQDHAEDPFFLARSLSSDFPSKDENIWNQFFANGFCIQKSRDLIILNINSCFFHLNETEATKGKINSWQLEKLSRLLEKEPKKSFKIAFTHHAPYEYNPTNSPGNDAMIGGSNLVNLLNKHEFNILIHGHKHDPILSYAQGPSDSITFFSAGSFSVLPNRMLSRTLNSFHLMTLESRVISGCVKQGKIISYNYNITKGWTLGEKISSDFPANAGFGCRMPIREVANLINKWYKIQPNVSIVQWPTLVEALPFANYLLPQDLIKLAMILENEFRLKITPEPPHMPQALGALYG
jgi:predicted phosphodiesterase